MFAVTFLGTSASVPSAERNHPGLLVEAGSHWILVDCGEGVQRQLLRSCGIVLWRTDYLQPMDETMKRGEGAIWEPAPVRTNRKSNYGSIAL
jgi:hypothetical protein